APTVLNCDGAALDPAEFAQPPNKCVNPRALACSRPPAEPADRRLLRPRRQRPSGRAAEERDELASSHSAPRRRAVGDASAFRVTNLKDSTPRYGRGCCAAGLRPG